ncbi:MULTISPECIES: hypothetical protein [unclassified Pseudoalteromonas]|uniref:hypothetical protein n=1 Tax=unclassified Pseudoalteromonas TaxID=194690 RepID=UPI0030146AA6
MTLNAKAYLVCCYLMLGLLSFGANATKANRFYQVSEQVFFITGKQASPQPNQALLVGSKCALLAGLHADWVAMTALIDELKQRLSVPLCYAVSLHSEVKQQSAIVLLQQAYPNLQWLTPNAVSSSTLQHAFKRQLELFKQSISLSQTRVAALPQAQQPSWQEKLKLAQARVSRWSQLSQAIVTEQSVVSDAISLDLGKHLLTISPTSAYSKQDLLIQLPAANGIIAGYSADLVPPLNHSNWQPWQDALKQLHSSRVSWILPASGKPFPAKALHQPLQFFSLLSQSDEQQVRAQLKALYSNPNMQLQALRRWQQWQTRESLNKI